MLHTQLQPLLWPVLGGLLLSFVSVTLWFLVNSPHDSFVVGRVVEVSDAMVLISDRRGEMTTITFTASTHIDTTETGASGTPLVIGDFIQVSGSKVNGAIEASSIRILKAPPGKPLRKPDAYDRE